MLDFRANQNTFELVDTDYNVILGVFRKFKDIGWTVEIDTTLDYNEVMLIANKLKELNNE